MDRKQLLESIKSNMVFVIPDYLRFSVDPSKCDKFAGHEEIVGITSCGKFYDKAGFFIPTELVPNEKLKLINEFLDKKFTESREKI